MLTTPYYPRYDEGVECDSSQPGKIEMRYMEITEIDSGVRELTNTELAMVAGGGVWGDLAKIAGGVIGNALWSGALGGGASAKLAPL